jgi:hypothetical protein
VHAPRCVTNSARRANHFRFAENLSSPGIKNISLFRIPKSVAYLLPSHPAKGRIAIVTRRVVGCNGRRRADGEGRLFCVRRSRVVLAPRPWRLSCGRYPADNGDNKRRSPGRARISRQTIARGESGCLGCTCQTRVRSYYPLHTVLRAQSAPGFPCALSSERDNGLEQPGQKRAAGMRRLVTVIPGRCAASNPESRDPRCALRI